MSIGSAEATPQMLRGGSFGIGPYLESRTLVEWVVVVPWSVGGALVQQVSRQVDLARREPEFLADILAVLVNGSRG